MWITGNLILNLKHSLKEVLDIPLNIGTKNSKLEQVAAHEFPFEGNKDTVQVHSTKLVTSFHDQWAQHYSEHIYSKEKWGCSYS